MHHQLNVTKLQNIKNVKNIQVVVDQEATVVDVRVKLKKHRDIVLVVINHVVVTDRAVDFLIIILINTTEIKLIQV